MQSNGGLTDAAAFQGKDAILSGPPAASSAWRRPPPKRGFRQVIGFDMGGTSTDVSHFRRHYERSTEKLVAGVRVRAPMLEIHTVAAGGGSICHFDGSRFRVGPDSAGRGAGPRPATAAGGPAHHHRLQRRARQDQAEHFPPVFGPAATSRSDVHSSLRLCEALRPKPACLPVRWPRASSASPSTIWPTASNRSRSPAGHDVSRYTLHVFGGAGGQHACLVADALGMERVMIHPLAGVLSAYGMGLADMVELRQRSLGGGPLEPVLDELAAEASAALRVQGVNKSRSGTAPPCATKAATPHWRCPSRRPMRCGQRSRTRTAPASASPLPKRP
jgi:5-oxoprolinase (ATP-hydrolysing)